MEALVVGQEVTGLPEAFSVEEAAPFHTRSSLKDVPNLLLAERQATHQSCQLGRQVGESRQPGKA